MCVLCNRNRILRAYLYSEVTGTQYASSFYLQDYCNSTEEYAPRFCLQNDADRWQGLPLPLVIHMRHMYEVRGEAPNDRIHQLYPRE